MRPRALQLQLLLLFVCAPTHVLFAAPTITSVLNAASNKDPRLPGSSIAAGGIFIVKGRGLGPENIVIAPAAFQSTTLSGTSIKVTANGTSVNALMYYTSATQIAALLPSSTPPAGLDSNNTNTQATITVTYNGESSDPTPFRGVTGNAVGIFTIDSSGTGPAIVTYPDYSLVSPFRASTCGGPNTFCGAANPGETLILWATGLGPIPGNEAAGAGLGQNMPNIPVNVWLGGVKAAVLYQGRSGCCVGEDQIAFTVPDHVPTGCAVPLFIQIATGPPSNHTVMPVAPTGIRDCTLTDPSLASANLQQLGASGSFTMGALQLSRILNATRTDYDEFAEFDFFRVSSISPGLQPFFASYFDQPAVGTCTARSGSLVDALFNRFTLTPIDAGSRFTVVTPKTTLTLTANTGQHVFPSGGFGGFSSAGNYTITGGSGTNVGAFTARNTVPPEPTLTSPTISSSLIVRRPQGLTLTWNAGAVTGTFPITLIIHSVDQLETTLLCTAQASAGTFTIPPSVLVTVPPGSVASLTFRPDAIQPTASALFSASGLDVGIMQSFLVDLLATQFMLQ